MKTSLQFVNRNNNSSTSMKLKKNFSHWEVNKSSSNQRLRMEFLPLNLLLKILLQLLQLLHPLGIWLIMDGEKE